MYTSTGHRRLQFFAVMIVLFRYYSGNPVYPNCTRYIFRVSKKILTCVGATSVLTQDR
eukprot:SAG31_NODE_3368_length_4355_cov_29.144267_3_plen_57_part_01